MCQFIWNGQVVAGIGGVGVNSASYDPKGLVGIGNSGKIPSKVYGYGPTMTYPYGDGGLHL